MHLQLCDISPSPPPPSSGHLNVTELRELPMCEPPPPPRPPCSSGRMCHPPSPLPPLQQGRLCDPPLPPALPPCSKGRLCEPELLAFLSCVTPGQPDEVLYETAQQLLLLHGSSAVNGLDHPWDGGGTCCGVNFQELATTLHAASFFYIFLCVLHLNPQPST